MSDVTADLASQMILAVDDEPDNLAVLKTTLEVLHNAIVCIALNSEEALQQLETFQPTLIIADISMPKVDGFGLLKILRERPNTMNLPVFALTAHAMKGDRERILGAGFDGYITKPYDIMMLGGEVERLLCDFVARQSANPNTSESAESVAEPSSHIALLSSDELLSAADSEQKQGT